MNVGLRLAKNYISHDVIITTANDISSKIKENIDAAKCKADDTIRRLQREKTEKMVLLVTFYA